MKIKLHPLFTFPALLLCFTQILPSCNGPAEPGVYKDDNIKSGVRNTLHSLNTELLSALKVNDQERLENLMSQDLIDNRHERLVTSELASLKMKQADYDLMAEYYIVNKAADKKTEVMHEKDMGINNFDFSFSHNAQEMYIAFFTSKSAIQKSLITAIYNKYDYGWKISSLECKPYADNGRTAPELMRQAKELLKKGYWLDASNTGSFALDCMRPSDFWTYSAEKDMMAFEDMALDSTRAHYKLPLTMKAVSTQPRIWRIRVERTPDGAFPNVNYISNIKLYNTDALKKENEEVGKAIGNVLAGIDKDKKFIYYTIYNEVPQGVDYRDHVDMSQKLK